MKYLFSLFFCSFVSLASVPQIQMKCPKYDENIALELEPNKKYFRDTVRVRIDLEEATLEETTKFTQQFKIDERRIKLINNEVLAQEIGAPVVYSMKYYRAKYFGRPNNLTTHHVPAKVTLKTPYGYLAGDSRGEFGGELVFINLEGNVSILKDMNVEDIYELNFGYVITEGLSHMSSDWGMIYVVSFENNKPKISKLFGLIGAPESSLKLNNGDLLINSRDGSQLLRSDGTLIRVQCSGS